MEVTVNVTVDGKKRAHTVSVPVGENLEELEEAVGDDVVYHYAKKGIEAAARALVSAELKKEDGDPPMTWIPVIRRRGKSPVDKALDLFRGLSAEEREAVLNSM